MKRVLKPKVEANQSSALNQARALYYDFFAGFFVFELLEGRFEIFNKQIEILSSYPLDSADGETFSALLGYLKRASLAEIKREYSQTFDIPFGAKGGNLADKSAESSTESNTKSTFAESTFAESSAESSLDKSDNESFTPQEALEFEKLHKTLASLPKGQIFLYLSHYNEGCLNGASLLKAKQLVKQTRFRLNSESYKESEEHFGFLLLFMSYLLRESAESINAESSNEFFNECLRPMASTIADLLVGRDDLQCYQRVGVLLKNFITIEEEICA